MPLRIGVIVSVFILLSCISIPTTEVDRTTYENSIFSSKVTLELCNIDFNAKSL